MRHPSARARVTCPECGGTGECARCEGRSILGAHSSERDCPDCRNGVCRVCDGEASGSKGAGENMARELIIEGVRYVPFQVRFRTVGGHRRRWRRWAPALQYAAESTVRELDASDIAVKPGSLCIEQER